MKAFAILGALLCAVAALGQVVQGGYAADSVYNKLWVTNKVTTINGTVTGKLVSPPLKGMDNSVALMVKQKDREPFEVQLGPQWFVSKMPVQINTGDKITVSGSEVQMNGRSVIMAESITKGKTQVLFRGRTGAPRWVGVIVEAVPVDVATANGTLVATDVTVIDGVEHQLFRVETVNGTVDIVGAPTWYANRQNYQFNVGSSLTIMGTMRPVAIGRNLYLADGINASGSTFILRPFGY